MSAEKRKKIGIITTDPEYVYQRKVIEGVSKKAAEFNYDILVFATFVKGNHINIQYLEGESNIFNIINFDMLDGVILLSQYFTWEYDSLIRKQISTLLRNKCHCPVITLDEKLDDYEMIRTDDVKSFEMVTNHVIEEHGCRNIIMLAGNSETLASRMRVEGFRKSLSSHGIEIKESNIIFGDFWYTLGESVAQQIVRGEIEKPDAVVAASDYIGLGFINEIVKHGIRIPDDIIVTGFDGVIESRANEITLTSYIPSIAEIGEKALVRIAELIEEREFNHDTSFSGKLVYGMSCGCRSTNAGKRERDDFGYIAPTLRETDMKRFLQSYMTETLTASETMDDCMDQIMKHAYLVDNSLEYFLCTCENWQNMGEESMGNNVGYTEQVKISVYRCIPEIFDEWSEETNYYDPYVNKWFDSSLMLPKIFEEKRKEPAVFYFTPVHFNGRRIGYSVMRFNMENCTLNFIYQQWSRNVNNALEMMRVRELLFARSTRDNMTGLYNRNSVENHMTELLALSVKNNTVLYVTFVDMNSLKYINDKYGHDAGDNAICTLAGIISSVCIGNSVCIRMGGDEFLILGQCTDAETEIKNRNQAIDERLEAYNNSSDNPYKVTASYGSCCGRALNMGEFESMVKTADERMYEYKINFKKNNRVEKKAGI